MVKRRKTKDSSRSIAHKNSMQLFPKLASSKDPFTRGVAKKHKSFM